MAQIPLGISSYTRSDGMIPETLLKNFYLEKSEQNAILRIKRPGLSPQFGTADNGFINGLYQTDGVLGDYIFIHSNNKLMRKLDTSLQTLGTIVHDTDNNVRMVGTTFNLLAIVASSGFYIYNGVNVTHVNLPDANEIPVDVTTLNQYIFVICQSGRIYWILPGETGWYGAESPLQYVTAELEPDRLVGATRLGDQLFMFGSRSVEVWSATGDQQPVIRTNPGRAYNKGCLARDTIQIFDNNVMWVGDDGILYNTGNVPTRMSNHSIEEKIRNRTNDFLKAYVINFTGHQFYVLKIPGQGTFGFDISNQTWSEWTSNGLTTFAPDVAIQIGNETYLGSGSSGDVWTLNAHQYVDKDSYDNDSVPIDCVVSGTIFVANTRPIKLQSMSVTAGSSGNTSLQVQLSDDGTVFTNPIELSLPSPRHTGSIYRIGSLKQPLKVFKITYQDDGPLVIYQANVSESYVR